MPIIDTVQLRWDVPNALASLPESTGSLIAGDRLPFLKLQFDPESVDISLSAFWEGGDQLGDPRSNSLSYQGTTGRVINFTVIANDYGIDSATSEDDLKVGWPPIGVFSKEIIDNFTQLTLSNRDGSNTQRAIQWLMEATRPVPVFGDEPPTLLVNLGPELRIRGVITNLSYEITMVDPSTRAPIRAEIELSIQEIPRYQSIK